MLQYSFTDKISNAVDLLQNRVDSRRSVKAIALYSRLLTAGTDAARLFSLQILP